MDATATRPPAALPGGAGQPTPPGAGFRSFVTTTMLLLTVLALTALAQLAPDTSAGWLTAEHDTGQAVWPQGWRFFTARDGLTRVGAYHDAPGYPPVDLALTSAANLGGVSRRGRALLAEVTDLIDRVPPGAWRACAAATPAGCAAPVGAATPVPLDNRAGWPPLCGAYLLTREHGAGPDRVVDAVARVRLTCPS